MKNEITIKDLADDLIYCQNLKDRRLLILFLDLYMENFVHALYKKVESKHHSLISKLNFFKRKEIASTKTKAKNLAAWNELNKDPKLNKSCLEVYLLLHKLRNELIHHLKPNVEIAERWINNHEPTMNDLSGLIAKFLKKKASPWDKIQLYAFPVITDFYHRLAEARDEEANYTIIFEITPKADAMRIDIIPK